MKIIDIINSKSNNPYQIFPYFIEGKEVRGEKKYKIFSPIDGR